MTTQVYDSPRQRTWDEAMRVIARADTTDREKGYAVIVVARMVRHDPPLRDTLAMRRIASRPVRR